jgi:hypothetical protein
MPRLARAEVFAPDEVAVVHVMNRVVRRCFLFGTDSLTGKNYDHRKPWIEQQLQRLAACFGIDLLGFAILSNHFHLILRSRPDVVAAWDDTEVARRWLMLWPVRKNDQGLAEEPNQFELNTIRNDSTKLATIRLRLSDIAWWMRLLCQNIAMRANHEDQEIGRFFQSRYRAVRLLDEEAILACAAYIDLNPIRAGIADTLETSHFTSVQRRIEALSQESDDTSDHKLADSSSGIESRAPGSASEPSPAPTESETPDQFLSPLMINEQTDPIGPDPSLHGTRCSNKGFLPMPLGDYLELLDWTARQLVPGKRGVTAADVPSLFERLSIAPGTWCELVGNFGRLFCHVAGHPQTVDVTRSRIGRHRYYVRQETRKLLTAQP